ncbi:unnamed protein product [Durusdinium trenchii]|uniref:Uncharacterized protein n=1 Tax=Durusdinium trenchii TaxID=1381693 RepID=A0ABP0Q5M9_9DINO
MGQKAWLLLHDDEELHHHTPCRTEEVQLFAKEHPQHVLSRGPGCASSLCARPEPYPEASSHRAQLLHLPIADIKIMFAVTCREPLLSSWRSRGGIPKASFSASGNMAEFHSFMWIRSWAAREVKEVDAISGECTGCHGDQKAECWVESHGTYMWQDLCSWIF